MKIQDKGPIDPGVAQALKEGKPAAHKEQKDQVKEGSGPTKVSISSEGRRLQQVADLAQEGDRMRAEKVAEIREKLVRGEYEVEAEEIAKALARSEIARLLGKE